MGKLSPKDLKELLGCIKKNQRVLVPPMPGFDSGVHLIGDKYVVVSTDPCIGVPMEWFGWLLIHYAASDVALFGAKPEFCTVDLLGPATTKPKTFHKIMRQACNAADQLSIAIVTGHTGTYEGLSTPVGVCTAYGTVEVKDLKTPGNAKEGDHIFCIKPIGLETVVNFALIHKSLAEKLFGTQRTQELSALVPMQSCVKEALLLAKIEEVHAMHDTTEGGLTAALNEIADASKVGFGLRVKSLPVSDEVLILQKHFNLSDEQVLSMSSTGTILAAVDPKTSDEVKTLLRQNQVDSCVLGVFTGDGQRIIVLDGKEKPFPTVADDPYARILSGKV
jgi:hydrogenase maturation factor